MIDPGIAISFRVLTSLEDPKSYEGLTESSRLKINNL